ncbi:ferredoxin--NADP reductase [Pontibacter beigongshangensis]|uniref:ferredoxin--NADP reductase n=1 Tax=Pontibacter beigongshangensis TaxID=2574733 RepID=UPI0016503057|nr:ferredoxin--NADP reductase [Pontibacter beigongshangensis]
MAAFTDNTESGYMPLRIAAITEEIKDFKTFEFDQESKLRYKAGQYLTFVHRFQGEEVRRSYSIISSPALQEPLAIGVKRIENGYFSRQLVDHARPGDVVLTTGAAGFFTLPDDMTPFKQVFLLAAGSGITPVLSILKTVLAAHPAVQVVLIYSNSSAQKTAFRDYLLQLKEQYRERLQLELLYSNSENLLRARLHRELLHLFLQQYAAAPLTQTLFYVCGPLNYMRMCQYTLRQAKVPLSNIRKESFNIDKSPPPPVRPPDMAAHTVKLWYRNEPYLLRVQYPDSILKVARKAGLKVPYSCETGRCGNCVARCRSGKVWMSYNEVLTEKELDAGLILTCTGYPIGGDAELEIT